MPSVPRAVTRLNKSVLNPIQSVYAPYLPPLAMIEHTGRRSGRTYSTPVVATKHGDMLYVAVLYGEQSDWLRNLLHAGTGRVTRAGRTYGLSDPEVRDAADTPGVAGQLLGRISGRVLRARISPD